MFNSQSLTHFDAYYHRFASAGTYHWGIYVKQNHVITVAAAPPGHIPRQRDVWLTYDGTGFVVSPADDNFQIFATDPVMWHNETPGPGIPGFSIVGDNGLAGGAFDGFNSRKLGVNDAFSHLFLQPGNFSYTISGGMGPQAGTASINALPPPPPAPPPPAPPAGFAVVDVRDGHPPNPDPVAKTGGGPVYIGDTVLWNVSAGTGLTIVSN